MVQPWPWFPHIVTCVQILDAIPICKDGLSPRLGDPIGGGGGSEIIVGPKTEQAEQGVF